MNKIKKYIFIGIILFLVVTTVIVLFVDSFESKNIQNDIKNELNQKPAQPAVKTTYRYKDISTEDFAVMLKNKDFTLVNVHIPYIGDIEGTDISIPFNTIADNLDKLPENKNSKIVLYCQSGSMSAVAADTLSQLEYTNVYDMKGGMIQWQKDGNTLIQK